MPPQPPMEIARWPRPAVAVDLVILTVLDSDLKVLLIQRGEAPYLGTSALPGGFVRVGDTAADQGEGLEEAARRELFEETALPLDGAVLHQVRTFGQPGRDPRGRVFSVVYCALVRPDLAPLATAGTDAAAVEWRSLTERPPLAFDHDVLLDSALAWVRERVWRTDLAFALVSPTFTISELRAVFEAVFGDRLDPGNFRRRFKRLEADGVLERAPGRRNTGARPAAVYRFVSR